MHLNRTYDLHDDVFFAFYTNPAFHTDEGEQKKTIDTQTHRATFIRL